LGKVERPQKLAGSARVTISNRLACGLLILAVIGTTAAADETAPFKITTKRDNDRVNVKVEKHKTIVSVDSPFGISHTVIERLKGKWPDIVVVQLRLKGLEHFQLTNGKVKLVAMTSVISWPSSLCVTKLEAR
jgi:hypothetical protein